MTFVTHQEIDFQAGFLVVVVKIAAHLGENVGNYVFKDSALVAKKISKQYIGLSALFQH